MAWAAIGAAEKAKETTAAEGITLDEEELLPQSSLATIRETFWKRYHWLPPPEQQPSDKLLSKLTRALQKRSLEVMNVFSVKTLFNQRSNPSTKRVKVAHKPVDWIHRRNDEVQPVENWSTYLDQLLVYLIGLAMAGAYALATTSYNTMSRWLQSPSAMWSSRGTSPGNTTFEQANVFDVILRVFASL